jgi:hypothetical protein
MRVALLASTFVLLAGSPAFAQCVYVACNGGQGGQPTYQQPVYQQPTYQAPPAAPRPTQNNARGDYDAGYAAGLAARPATRAVSRSGQRSVARPAPARRHVAAAPVRRTATATTSRRHATAVVRPATRHVVRVAPRPVVRQATRQAPRQVARTTYRPSYGQSGYVDPIKNRAGTYGSSTYGSATSMASLMSRSSSYSTSSTTSWVGPSAATSQNGQTCGWGARIVTNSHGYAQRQAVWVCQCPQGWRPPGY